MKVNTFCAVDFGNDIEEQIYTETCGEAAEIAAKSNHGGLLLKYYSNEKNETERVLGIAAIG